MFPRREALSADTRPHLIGGSRLSLDDAHLDSLALAEVLAAIEDAVGHCLEPAWVDQIETVAEFRAVVDQVLGP